MVMRRTEQRQEGTSTIQQLFERELKRIIETPSAILTRLFAEKAAAAGYALTDRERRRLERHLARDCSAAGLAKFKLRRKDLSRLTLTLDDSDLARGFGNRKDIYKKADAFVGKFLDMATAEVLRALKAGWPRERSSLRRERRAFASHIESLWGCALENLEFVVTIARAIAAESRGLPEPLPGEVQTREVLVRLHARACQVADEALLLLQHGFGDGAHARWRTLHELAVVATFVAERGECVAERYLAHVAVETCRGARQYQVYCRQLGEKKLTKREVARSEDALAAVVAKYGKDILTDYGWASESLGNKRPTFSGIEKVVNLDYMRPLCRLAGHNVHANPKGAVCRLGLPQEWKGSALAGPSDEGLGEATRGVSWSLMMATLALLQWKPNMDVLVHSHLLIEVDKMVGASVKEVRAILDGQDTTGP